MVDGRATRRSAIRFVHQASFIVHRSSFIVHRSSFIVHRSSFIVHRSSFIVHRSSFIVHRSPFIPQGRGFPMLLRISHETKLSYTSPVAETVFEVRMAPPTDEDQTNLGYRLRTTPQAAVTSYRDGMGNRVDLFNVTKPYRELVILATSYVRTHRRPGPERLEGLAHLGHSEIGVDAIELLQPAGRRVRGPQRVCRQSAPAGRGELGRRFRRGSDGERRRPAQIRVEGDEGEDAGQ
jgi:hypothetical protein